MNDRSWNDAAPTRRVVKLGGRVQQDPALPAALAALCAEHPGGVCVVHGGGDEGGALNVNGDDAAAALAAALGADEILFLADVPGVLVDGAVAPELDGGQARALIAAGVAVGGMAAKLEAAQAALAAGVPRARIGGLDALCDATKGTLLSAVGSRLSAAAR